MQHSPKVSVLMVTYNQEQFIAQAIEGALMQNTDFDFEIVIGEDCSEDSTRSIVEDYAKRFPEKIRLLLQPHNVGGNSNFASVYQMCRGQYVAFLEGDDYWTDPSKLQQQVDFLDSHPDYSLCFHWVDVFYQETGKIEHLGLGPPVIKPYYTVDDLLKYTVFIPTCSAISRNKIFDRFPDWYWESIMGDFILYLLIAQRGKIGFLDTSMGMYRVHKGGICGGRGGVPGGTTAITNLQRAIQTYALVGEHLGVDTRISYRCTVANMHVYLYRLYKAQRKYIKALITGYKALMFAPKDLRMHILLHNRFYSPLIQFLRVLRIRGLGLIKRLCGETRYNKLKSLLKG